MFRNTSLTVVALVALALCVALSEARPRGGQRGGGRRQGSHQGSHQSSHQGGRRPGRLGLGRFVCRYTDPDTSEDVTVRDCTACVRGPPGMLDDVEVAEVYYCNQEADWTSPRPFRGVLSAACSVAPTAGGDSILPPRECRDGALCELEKVEVTVNDTDYTALFCPQEVEIRVRSESEDSDSVSSEEDEDISEDEEDEEEDTTEAPEEGPGDANPDDVPDTTGGTQPE